MNQNETLTEAEQQREDRIKFHRTHVRNGPTSFKGQTSGQAKRAKVRELARRTKAATRSQRQTHHANKLSTAVLRGKLQQAGALPYEYGGIVDPVRQVEATLWLVVRFGIDDEDGRKSFTHDDVLVGVSQALEVYGKLTGNQGIQIPEGYVVPVYLEDAA